MAKPAQSNKLRVTQDYERLSDKLQEQIKLVYPYGFSKYLIQFTNSKGEQVSALRFETDEKIYLVRMSVQEAKNIISQDVDYDDDGNLKEEVKDEYEDKYSDIDYLSENETYE